MVLKRKSQSTDDLDGDQSVPLPIQTFFWRQTSPFIRPKQGKLCEASCVSFERVVVQNILHGLSPSLCEAVQSVSRWKVVQAAFPHLMHACSSLITACKRGDVNNKFGSSETKLLYTLHWILLDAASECEDADAEIIHSPDRKRQSSHMHALSTVQLFVYLFAPLLHLMKDADFESLKLENGLRLWQPLWEYQQPEISCFATPVKPQRSVLKAQRNQGKLNTNAANIYVGKGTSRENLVFLFDEPIGQVSPDEAHDPNAPLARMSDICTLSTAESQTATLELICENCNTVIPMQNPESGMSCRCGRKDNLVAFLPDSNNYAFLKLTNTVDKDYVKQKLASAVTSCTRAPGAIDILSASYLDVSVLRCLFCLSWSEDGIYWALRYMHQRILEVCQEFTCSDGKERSRSSSLPIPDLNVLLAPTTKVTPQHVHTAGSGSGSISGVVPEVSSPTMKHVPGLEMRRLAMTSADNIPITEHRKEPPFKKIRVAEFKQFFDSSKSFLRKKETVEHDGKDDGGTGDTDGESMRPGSALGHFKEHEEDFGLAAAACRKSLPTLIQGDKDSVGSSSQCSVQDSSASSQADFQGRNSLGDAVRKPIIRITEHSPELKTIHTKSGSATLHHDSHLDDENSDPLPRSYTDSNIAYKQDGEISEVSGSKFYIQENGHINYKVVLRALHFVAMNEHSPRICEVLLNLLNCLLDLDIVESRANEPPPPQADSTNTNASSTTASTTQLKAPGSTQSSQKTTGANHTQADKTQGQTTTTSPSQGNKDKSDWTSSKDELTTHSLAMDSLFRIYKALGCPHGCGDGLVGPQGDHLRVKGQNCLHRLHRIHPALFHKYLRDTIKKRPLQETVDFLHAFLGFCIDPALLVQSPSAQKKSVSQENLPKSGYGNNFGHSIGGEGYRGVEGVMIANLAKPLVSRCVECAHELYGTENISLFCDLRQMMAYIKEIHGGTFRRVALSGLLDSLQKLRRESDARKKELAVKKESNAMTASLNSESGDERENNNTLPVKPASLAKADDSVGRRKSRKGLFRSKITKVSKSLMFQYAASDSEILDEVSSKSPRTSISAAEEDSPNSSTTPRRRFSKLNIGWRRGTKSDHEDEMTPDPSPLDRRESRSEIHVHQGNPRGRMSFRAASQATLTFLRSRKKIEDGIKIFSGASGGSGGGGERGGGSGGGGGGGGKRMSRRSSPDDHKGAGGGGGGGGSSGGSTNHASRDAASVDTTLVKEKKLVDKFLIKSGMLRFSFLLECCHPGSLPDPQMVAAMLTLDAPVSARAALLLECAHFIHRCNRGDWPNWMKLNLPSFRHTVAALQNRGQPSGYRRNLMLQRAAGRMFYSWAENLGLQLEYILAKEHADRLAVIDDVKDETRRKELRHEDEDEDFLDEASINQTGKECPYALKMLACLVLLEITTFLRETFQYLPRSRCQVKEKAWEKTMTSRRFSSIVSSPGHSDKSSESNLTELPTGITGNIGSPGDRKISFAVLTERSDSLHSSTTSLSVLDPLVGGEEKKEKGRRLAQGRQKLLRHFRRGSGNNLSFRRSFKMSRPEGGSIRRSGSIKSRKISSHSLQSDTKLLEDEVVTVGGGGMGGGGGGVAEDAESVTVMSDDTTQDSPGDKELELEDEHMYTQLKWIKVVVQLANLSNFICTHQNYCHPNCYERQRRSCSRLIAALRKIYDSTHEDENYLDRHDSKRDMFKDKLRRRESIFQVVSPAQRRRESTPLLEKIKTDVSITKLKLNSSWKKDDKPKEAKEDPPIIKYLTSQAQRLTQCPMAILTKAAPILNVEHFIDIMPVAWELMLESDQELAAAAASVFLLSSAKSSDKARNMIIKELQHEETSQRVNALLRFQSLWKFRFQVWPRMEEGANMYFKLPPPSIDFTLPSPTIGMPMLNVVDPPWMPHFKTKIEEVTVNQEETKSLVTATTTRRKQQQEMIRKALLAEEERKRVGRENFPMTTAPISQLAAYEPSLHHGDTEHEEAIPEELSLAARRVSLAPTNRANNQSRSMSWRNGSLHWGKLAAEGDEDRLEHSQNLQLAQSVFPSCICAAVLPILHLLDDHDVNAEGVSVAEVAYKVIWECIVDDPILFLRHFLEKLTNKDRQEELMFLLRKMILYFPQMPAQAAHSIFNYLIGYIMFYVRTPCEGGQDAIAGALSLLWLSIPCVQGIYFKDLKQTLKKEQCDPYLLVSASVASAKKILVHGPDLSSIPSQLLINEVTQFYQILQESLEFFNIPEEQHDSHFLVDTKTHQIHNNTSYVRDFYFFRRNFYPQLSLVHMNPEDAQLALQKRVFTLKFVEIGKVLLTNAVMETTPSHQLQNHVSFLHEELSKLPSFPRKALETEFDMHSGTWGKEIFGMDSLHKYSWAKLMGTMFKSMSSTLTWSHDLWLLISVLNGTIVLQLEDTSILRFCLATLINACRHFKHIFATNGFLYVMPTLLRVYSNNQPNPVVCKAIHYVCKQFYILHRKPFVLQMFGSVAAILDMQTGQHTTGKDCSKVQPESLFKLLLALEKYCPDHLNILDLVNGEKPLKPLDFCYENDPPDSFNLMEVVSMCVTVIAYAPDSFRSGQMLTILEMVIPRYLEHLKRETSKRDNSTSARAEVAAISNLSVSIRALVTCCELFARNMSLPQRFLEAPTSAGLKPMHNHNSVHSLTADDREDSHASRHMEEGRRKTHGHEPDDLELREDFRKPRDSLLSICADFYTKSFSRFKELRRILSDPVFRPPELLDYKAHNRLAEIAHTLLKLAPYDPVTMACTGLQRYMLEILPTTDWSNELIRPGLNLILRRLDRLFTKVSKKSGLRKQVDWEAAANILKGVYQTLRKFSFIALLPHLKTLVNVLITILLTSSSSSILPEGLTIGTGSHRSEPSALQSEPSPVFVSAVVKLVAMQMQALGDQYTLDQICGGVAAFSSNEKSLNLLINFILPLCIRVGSNCRDTPRLSHADVTFVLTVILSLLSPPSPSPNQHNAGKSSNYLSIGEFGHSISMDKCGGPGSKQSSDLYHHTALVGLEILTVCYDKQLSGQWHHVAKCIQTLGTRAKVDLPIWKFLDFLVTHRPSLFVLLQTFIQFKMLRVNCDTAQEYYLQQTIKDKLQGYTFSYHKSASAILVSLAIELRQLRDELANTCVYRSRATTFATEHSDYSQTQIPERLPNASITEIATEIIGPVKTSRSSLTKRSSRGTLFSQSSSTTSAPLRSQTAVPSSEESPSLQRGRSGRRIAAKEGSRILEKFTKKPPVEEVIDLPSNQSPLLHRQGTIRFHASSLSKQNSQDLEGSAGYDYSDTEPANGRVGVINGSETAAGSGNPEDPRDHRLQRADAKSRKTFKIKRAKTKTSVRPRFMSHRKRLDFYAADGGDGREPTEEMHGSRTTVVFHDKDPSAFQFRRHGTSTALARSVETIPESSESSRTKMLQRSRSHDDPGDVASYHADRIQSSTRSNRMHRQGAGRIAAHTKPPGFSPNISPQSSITRLRHPASASQEYVVQVDVSERDEDDKLMPKLSGQIEIDHHHQRCSARKGNSFDFDDYTAQSKKSGSAFPGSPPGRKSVDLQTRIHLESRHKMMKNGESGYTDADIPPSGVNVRHKPNERERKTGKHDYVGARLPPTSPPTALEKIPPTSPAGDERFLYNKPPLSPTSPTSIPPTRRHAVRGDRKKSGSSTPLSPMQSPRKEFVASALEQIKSYASPMSSPTSIEERPFYSPPRSQLQEQPDILVPLVPDLNVPHHKDSKESESASTSLSTTSQKSSIESPERKVSFSGSSGQTSPSHVTTSFSSTPNNSPVRKPSFSSSQTSPTRKVSYSSSSTTDSPTHKLFYSYRNSPSHRTTTGFGSYHDSSDPRKTSFSSSSFGSPVRKPSFSSSSDSKNKPTYSSTTSSASSLLSSPTHIPGRPYGSMSPLSSPTKSSTTHVGGAMPGAGPLGHKGSGSCEHLLSSTPPSADSPDLTYSGRYHHHHHQHHHYQPPRDRRDPSTLRASSGSSATLTPDDKSQQSKSSGTPSPIKPNYLNLMQQEYPHLAAKLTTTPNTSGSTMSSSASAGGHNTGPASFSFSPPLSTTPSSSSSTSSSNQRNRSNVRDLVGIFDKRPNPSSGSSSGVGGGGGSCVHGQSHSLSRFSSSASSTLSPSSTNNNSLRNLTSPQLLPHDNTADLPHSQYGGSHYQLTRSSTGGSSSATTTPNNNNGYNNDNAAYSRSPYSSVSAISSGGHGGGVGATSPLGQGSLLGSPSSSSVYVSRCDSSDSLSANESSSLLRDEEKCQSHSSLYYADEDVPDRI